MVPGYISLVILIGMRVERVLHAGGAEEMDLRGRVVSVRRRGRSRSTTWSGFIR